MNGAALEGELEGQAGPMRHHCIGSVDPLMTVSYTHLTLPTIYSV